MAVDGLCQKYFNPNVNNAVGYIGMIIMVGHLIFILGLDIHDELNDLIIVILLGSQDYNCRIWKNIILHSTKKEDIWLEKFVVWIYINNLINVSRVHDYILEH